MKRFFLFFVSVLIVTNILIAQSTKKSEAGNAAAANESAKKTGDSLIAVFVSKAQYPLIKSSKMSGVLPVDNVDEKPDITKQYNLLMEVITGMKGDNAAVNISANIAEIGRLINIHIAAGVPRSNLHVVVVAHGPILKSFYNGEVYKENFKIENPNMKVFDEMLATGVKFIACGQAMNMLNIRKDELVPWMKVALSAQTVITDYQLKGFILRKIETDK